MSQKNDEWNDPLRLGQFSQQELLEKWLNAQPEELEVFFDPGEPVFLSSSDSGQGSSNTFDLRNENVIVVVGKEEDISFLGAVVDCIPFVGSAKQGYDLIKVLEDEESTGKERAWKIASFGASVTFDILTLPLMAGGFRALLSGGKIVWKSGLSYKVAKVGAKVVLTQLKKRPVEIGCTVAARAAVVCFANSKSREMAHIEKPHVN